MTASEIDDNALSEAWATYTLMFGCGQLLKSDYMEGEKEFFVCLSEQWKVMPHDVYMLLFIYAERWPKST